MLANTPELIDSLAPTVATHAMFCSVAFICAGDSSSTGCVVNGVEVSEEDVGSVVSVEDGSSSMSGLELAGAASEDSFAQLENKTTMAAIRRMVLVCRLVIFSRVRVAQLGHQ